MITCPYCGTNYQTFQSNCAHCGAPLPAQAQAAGLGDETGTLPVPEPPPAAPRPISDRYVWKLMAAEGWSIAGLVFVVIGFIFGLVGAVLTVAIITAFVGIPFLLLGIIFLLSGGGAIYWRYQANQKLVQVLKFGQSAPGAVTAVQENYSVTVNGRHPWAIDYQFAVNGQAFTGKVGTLNQPGPQLQSGRPVYVLYMPGDPRQNSLYPHP